MISIRIEDFSGISPERLLKDLALWDVPINLDKICESLGVIYSSKMRFGDEHSGEIKVDEDKNIHVWVNPLDHPNRMRFTLAHEIGHLINDILPNFEKLKISEFTDTQESLKRDGRQHPEEYRANDFAARLLMPEALVIERGKQLLDDLKAKEGKDKISADLFVKELAKIFLVFEQEMSRRLKNIGVLYSNM